MIYLAKSKEKYYYTVRHQVFPTEVRDRLCICILESPAFLCGFIQLSRAEAALAGESPGHQQLVPYT